jgi:hypothetical protein
MKRDFDLIRSLLKDIEATPAGETPIISDFPDYDDETVGEHLALLVRAGLIDGDIVDCMGSNAISAIPYRLTWEGHEFIGAAREDSLWNKAKSRFLTGTTSFTFGILKQWLEGQIGL